MKYIFIVVCVLIGSGCQVNPTKPDESRMFNVDGKWIEITEELQNELRANWSKGVEPIVVKTRIPSRKDTLYILDMISIQEVITGDGKCKNYEIDEIDTTNLSELSEEDRKYPVGRVDETWNISICGKTSRYRVLEIADERGISSYKLMP